MLRRRDHFPQIQEHYYVVHNDINPPQVMPAGPDTSSWLMEPTREQFSDRPFADGTPPGPLAPQGEVPANRGPGGAAHR